MSKFKRINISEKKLLSSAETKALLIKANQGEQGAKDKLVRHNLRLVLKIAHRFKTEQYEIDELFQVGSLGLITAIEGFDTTRDVEFSTYAVPVIIGKIKSHLRADNPMKVGRTLQQRANQIKKMEEILTQELNREPTIKELSQELDLSCNQIVRALEATQTLTSIYEQVYHGEKNSLELIDQLTTTDDQYEKQIDRLTLAEVLVNLKPRSKKIIKMRYFADKSQAEVATIIGVSQAQVSRLEKKILRMIREKIKNKSI
ncbi:MAG: SigB/SigF/SigG family RNA polymerase sigma factor [Bacillota bacterium]